MTKQNEAQWVCHDCGTTFGKWYIGGSYVGPASHCATYHVGSCDVCGKTVIPVTEPRDYGGLASTEPALKAPEDLTDLIVHVIDDFPFAKVHQVMKLLEWKWVNDDYSSGVPDIPKMRECAQKLLNTAIEQRNSDYLAVGTGGFMAEVDDQGLSLSFVLAQSEFEFTDFQ